MADDENGEALLASVLQPWQVALHEGWAAFCAGNPPVGAVITGPDGNIVAAGRNRRFDDAGPAGHIVGSNLAHAEVNACAQLQPGDYSDYTLWATLQPCPLCSSAVMITSCGHVRFLAADPMWHGADRLPELNDAVAERWPIIAGPESGWPASWQTMLSVAYQASRGNASGPAVTARAAVAPRATHAGLALADDPDAMSHLKSLTLTAALSRTPPPSGP